jgi:hypothetical protein
MHEDQISIGTGVSTIPGLPYSRCEMNQKSNIARAAHHNTQRATGKAVTQPKNLTIAAGKLNRAEPLKVEPGRENVS